MIRFQHVHVVFCQLSVSQVWNCGLRGMFCVGMRAKKGLLEKGQLIYSMGLVWRILAQRATNLT